jgi:transcriptional regulator with XRE-family HTH domain
MNIGPSLKKIRLQKEYTITEVAQRTKISTSLLSQIENGKITPSLQTLEVLLRFYAVNFSDFFKQAEQKKYIYVRNTEAETMENSDHNIRFTLLASKLQNNSLESFLVNIGPGAVLTLARLDDDINGERIIYGVAGSTGILLDEESFILESGDSINFKSYVSCTITNRLASEATLFIAGLPPIIL